MKKIYKDSIPGFQKALIKSDTTAELDALRKTKQKSQTNENSQLHAMTVKT